MISKNFQNFQWELMIINNINQVELVIINNINQIEAWDRIAEQFKFPQDLLFCISIRKVKITENNYVLCMHSFCDTHKEVMFKTASLKVCWYCDWFKQYSAKINIQSCLSKSIKKVW